MADFPGKVNTQTSVPNSQAEARQVVSVAMDMNFIASIPGILLLVETVVGLLVWALVASVPQWLYPAMGWVLFVGITFWILSVLLFIVLFLNLRQKMAFVPWPLVLMVFYMAATVLYLTAFLTVAITAGKTWSGFPGYNELAASSFFAIVVTLAYGASSFFAYMDWKGDGGSATATTVPV